MMFEQASFPVVRAAILDPKVGGLSGAGCEGTMEVSLQQSRDGLAAAGLGGSNDGDKLLVGAATTTTPAVTTIVSTARATSGAASTTRVVSDDVSTTRTVSGATTTTPAVTTDVSTPRATSGAATTTRVVSGDVSTPRATSGAAPTTRAVTTDVSTPRATSGAASTTRVVSDDVSTPRATSGAATTTPAVTTDVSTPRATSGAATTTRVVSGDVSTPRAASGAATTTPALSGDVPTARAVPTDVSTTRAVSGAATTTPAVTTAETASRVAMMLGEELVEAGLVPRSRVAELLAKDVEHSLAWKLATVEALKIRKAKLYGLHVRDPVRKAAVDAENELVLADLPRSPPMSRDRGKASSKSTKAERTAAGDMNALKEEVMRLEAALKAMRAAPQRPISCGNACADEDEASGVEAGRVYSGSRAIRVAAASAIKAIQGADWRGSARTRRMKRRGAEGDEPAWTEEVLERLVDRKDENRVVFYRVEWTDYEGDDRFSWEPAENLVGHEKWMQLVNHYKDQVEGRHRPGKVVPKSLAAWLKTNLIAVALGDEAEMRCFFLAVRAVMDLLNLPMFNVEGCVSRLDKTVFSRVNGVAAGASVDVMKDLVMAGLEIDCDAWSVNLYRSELGAPKVAVEQSIAELIVNAGGDIEAYVEDTGEDSPVAVFMVATMDKMRVGHVWVLDVTKMGEMTVTDNGVLKAFPDMRVSEVLWVRRCLPRVGVQDLTKVKSVGVERAKVLGVGGFPRPTGEVGGVSESVGSKRRASTGRVQSKIVKKAKD